MEKNFDKIRVIIAGSRSFDDYDKLCKEVDEFISMQKFFAGLGAYKSKEVEIVSGGARGADKLGERYAKEHNLSLKVFPADWDKYGKRAGYIRNEEMAKYANCLIAFWDGQSKGTAHMIDLAPKYDLMTAIIKTGN